VEELKKTGMVIRDWLGLKGQNIDEDVAARYGLTDMSGVLINEITANAPADAAGQD
jgi:serine protease Do